MKSRQVKILFSSALATVIIFAILALVVWFLIVPRVLNLQFMTNREMVDYHEHHGLPPYYAHLVLDGRRVPGIRPLAVGENDHPTIYIPSAFIQEYFDPFLFWDHGAGVFFASTRTEMLEFRPDMQQFTINGQTQMLEDPIFWSNDDIYMPQSLIEGLYPLNIEFHAEYNMVVIISELRQTVSEIAVNSADIRVRPDSRAPIFMQLERGDEVVLFIDETQLSDDTNTPEYTRVRTPYGLIGYVATASLGDLVVSNVNINRTPLLSAWVENWTSHPPNWPSGQLINMTWEQVYHPDANINLMESPLHSSLTVVSPTWFRLHEEHIFTSVASRAYVEWAHSQGVYVWPLVFDSNNAAARAVLMNRDARRTVVEQLVHYVDTLNLDGINIDIEHLFAPEEGPYKIQFLRELAIPLRERGVVLSAAVKVPDVWSMFYRRDLIGLTVDFVQVMTYDEHWATHDTAGPVASLPWVQQAILNMLEEVPKEKLIMGIPFYSRVWREPVREDEPMTSRGLSMTYARSFFEERGVEWEWDATIGSYFGEVVVTEEGQTIFYRVWLEDERSIAAKMQIFSANDLAGVGSWRRGLEAPAIWDILAVYFS